MRNPLVKAIPLCLIPLTALAGGGSLVGNGGGLAEQNIAYAYLQLPKVIDSCTQIRVCDLSAPELDLLGRIRTILLANGARTDKFVFLSGAANPGAFETGVNEPNRVAKTELDPSAPIWFNTDIIDGRGGAEPISVSEASAILVHEVGHQAGVRDHQSLDYLGAKIRARLEASAMDYTLEDLRDDLRMTVKVHAFNYDDPAQSADLIYEAGGQMKKLNGYLSPSLRCSEEGATVLGYRFLNGHWGHSQRRDADHSATASFSGWVQFTCLGRGAMVTESADVEFRIRYSRLDQDLSRAVVGFSSSLSFD